MPISSHNSEDDSGKALSLSGIIWRAGLILLTLTIVCCSGVGYWHFTSRQKALAEFDAIVAKIRAQNGPLTGPEIDAYYAIPDGDDDLTLEYLAAIRGFDNVVLTPEQKQLPIVATSNAVPKPGEEWILLPVAEAYLQRFQPQLQALRDLANRKGSVRYPTKLSDGIATLLPHAQQIRNVARHLQLQYWVCMHRGDRAGALASLRGIVRAGETLQHEPTFISQLVRIAVFSIGVDHTSDFLKHGQATDAELQSLAELFAEIDFHKSLSVAMNGERAMGYLALQMKDFGQIDPADNGSLRALSSMGTMAELRPGDGAHLLEVETEMVEAAELPLSEAIEKFRDIEKRVKQMVTDEQRTLPWNRHILANMLVPAVTNVGEAFGRAASLLEGARAAVAVERQRLKTSEFPRTLAELVPEFLPAVPMDPFTGNALRYRVDEFSYTIYSVGPDKVDGGGAITAGAGRPPDIGVRIEFQAEPQP